VVRRLRIRYAKRGRLRFTSHRDIQRAFERALRRAGVPVGFSAGFSPHPKISWAGAAPTGVASEAEYVEIGVTEPIEPDAVAAPLDAALPTGLDVLEVVTASDSGLMDRLTASIWRIRLDGVTPEAAGAAVAAFVAADEVLVKRLTKHGMREFDTRGPVQSLRVLPDATVGDDEAAERADDQITRSGAAPDSPSCAILQVVVRHVTPAVRPDDVLAGLGQLADLVPPVPPLVTRLAQGTLSAETGTVTDPLQPDRAASLHEAGVAG
jgi:radical SAM-linked protein